MNKPERRLVDANKLQALLEDEIHFFKEIESKDDWDKGTIQAFQRARSMVYRAPTVEAVEVVRCRDCKHFKYVNKIHKDGHWDGVCYEWDTNDGDTPFTDADAFCSYAEPRMDAQEVEG